MVRLAARARRWWALALAFTAVGCGGPDAGASDAGVDALDDGSAASPDAGPARAIFVLPRDGLDAGFFDLPWPTDLRRSPEGMLDVAAFPNPRRAELLERYVAAIGRRQRGFATNGAVYFRLSRSVDPASLPADPAASLDAEASVFLIDVDERSPTRSQRHPAVVVYEDAATLYWPGRTIAIRPVYGIPLAGGRRYAAVLTRRVRTTDGSVLARDEDFAALLEGGGDATLEAARRLYRPALDAVVESGVAEDDVLALAVFTTQDPVGELAPFRDWMHAEYPAPTPRAEAWRVVTERPLYHQVEGRYGPVPVFQDGTIPYQEAGGAMELGADGEPVVHGEYDARFMLTVPTAPMPEQGYPIVLYAHGTGGDYASFVADGTAARLAEIGIAVMGIDQIHHGERNPTTVSPELLFFNVLNPDAARDNNRQSALDVVQQARVVRSLVIPSATLARDGRDVRFDPSRVYFFGHSQGGLVAPLVLGIDDGVRGAVISAGTAVITYALLEKTEPISIPEVLRVAIALPGSDLEDAFRREAMRLEHPVLTLVQGWIEASDGSNFGHLAFASPRAGFAPKSVLSTEGLRDTFSPPGSIEALATSMRIPIVAPVVRRIPAHDLLGLESAEAPLSGNVAGGAATAGLLQFADQGHFAVFRDATAQARIRGFFETMVAGTPTIPPP